MGARTQRMASNGVIVMALSEEIIKHLRTVRDEAEEILNELRDIMPPDFSLTIVARYTGEEREVKDMIWTEDIHDDVIRSLERERDNMEDVPT